ncbi:MAG TPA: alpha/beta hydrolase [Xanthobacteraceae bacterium]|nr:alpha/beta hydrolase [Xanthobacteraceae bacterium]
MVTLADARIWFATFGNPSAPAILLLHGGGGSSDYWGDLVTVLAATHHVIVIDSRGQGRSTNESDAISYRQMAADAIAVLDYIGVAQAIVLGWSDGANTGFYLALSRPDRIAALFAFAGNASPTGYQPNTNPAAMRAYVVRTKQEYETLSPHPMRFGEIMKQLSAMWKTEPALSASDLRRITVRTAVVHAEQDEVIRRAHSEWIAKQIPFARLVLLPEASHFAPLQRPKAFRDALLDFLAAP